jgi:molecular chaperone GrpE
MARMAEHNEEIPDRVIIRDKRRIDPVTGAPREPDPHSSAETGAKKDEPPRSSDEVAALESAVAERTGDLQRLQAEYANYRKRVERDRITVRDIAVRDVLVALLPILDDIDRARTHGDLTGAFKSVADQFDVILTKIGLESFGEVGDAFDPAVHEAVTHNESDEVNQPTATSIMRRGYRHADRLVRPAMVGVSEPAHAAPVTVEGAEADDAEATAEPE